MMFISLIMKNYCIVICRRYIDRFRNAPPSSRQERDHTYFDSGKGGEFWWLSPSPPNSSTPKDGTPPDQQLPSPRPSLSPKLRRSMFRRGKTLTSPTSVSVSSQIIVYRLRVWLSCQSVIYLNNDSWAWGRCLEGWWSQVLHAECRG